MTFAVVSEIPFAAESVIVWGVPGVNVMVAGDKLTPAGNPLTCTETCDENPLIDVAESEVVPEPPAEIDTEFGLTPNVKSGMGGGGGGG